MTLVRGSRPYSLVGVMKRNKDSLLGAAVFLAAATLVAYFGPDTHRDAQRRKARRWTKMSLVAKP